jgi:hypothetical protein
VPPAPHRRAARALHDRSCNAVPARRRGTRAHRNSLPAFSSTASDADRGALRRDATACEGLRGQAQE